MRLLYNNIRLSSSVTVSRYEELEKQEDRASLAKFIQERFEERYFLPMLDSQSKHGFTFMAIGCLVVETLEAFYQGRADTKGASKAVFREFFNRYAPLSQFGHDGDWFFENIRCGILHQGETRDGWRIKRSGLLLDKERKSINADQFVIELRKAVAMYGQHLMVNDDCWKNFKKKMKSVCANCRNS